MSIKNTIKLAMNWIKSNPQILITGLGIAASVATAITSGKAHAKAIADDNGVSDNLLDFAKRNWMTYIRQPWCYDLRDCLPAQRHLQEVPGSRCRILHLSDERVRAP